MAEATHGVEVISRLLLLTPRRLQQLTKEGHLPKAERGRYELVPVVQAYIRYLRDRAVKGDVSEDDYGSHKSRLVKAQADMAELDAERMRGELIPRAAVIAGWQAMIGASRARLLAVPSKSAPQVFTADELPDVERILRMHINDALTELGRSVGLPVSGGYADMASATGSDGEPVGGQQSDAKSRGKRRAGKVADEPSRVPEGDHGRRRGPGRPPGSRNVKQDL